jgi:hypothetical protein
MSARPFVVVDDDAIDSSLAFHRTERLSDEVTRVGDAAVLFDGTNSGCQGDCEQFKGPAFRYLTALYRALAKQGAHAPTSGPSGTTQHPGPTFKHSFLFFIYCFLFVVF